MTKQTHVTSAREYTSGNAALIIENIFCGNKSKADIIRALVEDEACLRGVISAQSGRDTGDSASCEREPGI